MSLFRHPAPWLVIFAGAFVVSISMGIRQIFGLFLPAMTADLGIGREEFAFALALQNLLWGVFAPFVGVVADRYGSGRMIALGGLVYAGGLMVMSEAESVIGLNLGAGLMLGFATAATGFAVVLGAVARHVPARRRSMALGLAAAGGSIGQFYMAPVSQGLLGTVGWAAALAYIAFLALLMTVMAGALTGKAADVTEGDPTQTVGQAIAEARSHTGFWYLTVGFFVCGFQVVFLAVHLPAYLQDMGFGAEIGAAALALIGFFNIIGTFTYGALGERRSKKYLLSGLYFLRAAVIAAFVVLPKTELTVLAFASALGLLWLATVPLTSGLVAQIFGIRYMATLFGIVFFSHQIGSFLGVWWGGYIFDTTGSYDQVWVACIVLGVVAGLLHLPIADRPLRPLAQES